MKDLEKGAVIIQFGLNQTRLPTVYYSMVRPAAPLELREHCETREPVFYLWSRQ
jgi:hypothetical protein